MVKVQRSRWMLLFCVALLLLLSLPPHKTYATGYPDIVIDGNTSDWSTITAIGTSAIGDVSSLKATNDAGQLFLLATGTGFAYTNNMDCYFFLDTDNNSSTGLNASPWNTDGAANGSDYMIDNGRLYRFNSSTDWSNQTALGPVVNKLSDTVIELYVPLNKLGVTPGSTIRIGFQKSDRTLTPNIRGSIPAAGNNLASVPLSNYTSGFTPTWSTITAAATGTGTVTGIKATTDGTNLYLHADGSGFDSVTATDFYLNSDNNVATGYYPTGWNSGGADYLIENSYVYSYSSPTSNTSWSWNAVKTPVTYDKTNTTIDLKVPLYSVGLEPGGTFRFGLILDNSSANRAPADNVSLPAVGLANKYVPAVPGTTVPWSDIRNFIVQYTIESQFDMSLLDDYQAVIIDPSVSREKVTELKTNRPASYAIGYLSIGETNGLLRDAAGRPLDIYFKDSLGNPIYDPNWPTSYYVDPRKSLWQDMILNQYLPGIFAKGFDGVFLDLVDIITYADPSRNIDFTAAQSGMADLIKAIKTKYPDKKVVSNGGFSLLNGGINDIRTAIDGVMLESYTSTWASPEIDPATGAFKEWYHEFPVDSYDYEWGERIARQLNKIRYEYHPDGTVVTDSSGNPVPSSTFFHVFALDYVKDGSTPVNENMMNDDVIRSWDRAFLPSVSAKELWVPPYNWLDTITTSYLTGPWGRGLDIPSMPSADRTIDDFSSGVGNWHTVRGGILSTSTDSAELTSSRGAAKLDVTVRGTVATNGTTHDPITQKNAAGFVSRDWLTPVDLSSGTVTLKAKISAPLPSDKAFEIEMRDENGDYKVWRNPVTLSNSYQKITLNPGTDSGYVAGTYGARDGFQADKVKSLEIRIVNTVGGSTDFTGTLWIDDVMHKYHPEEEENIDIDSPV